MSTHNICFNGRMDTISGLHVRVRSNFFSYFSTETYVVGAQVRRFF